MSLTALPQSCREVSTVLSCSDLDEALHITVLRDVIVDEAARVGMASHVDLWMFVRVYELVHPLTAGTVTTGDGNGGGGGDGGVSVSDACFAVLHMHAMRIVQRFIADGAPALVRATVCAVLPDLVCVSPRTVW